MSIIQMYAVTCNEREQLQYQKKAIKNTGDTDALRGEICRELHANRYAVIHYCDEVVILLDEVAAYKAHQPIWTICLENGTQMELSGKLLFARTWPTERGIKLIPIRAADIFHIRCFANLGVTGWTHH